MKTLREITTIIVTTHWDCAADGCKGEMLPDSVGEVRIGGARQHSCTICHRVEYGDKLYPVADMQPQVLGLKPTFLGAGLNRIVIAPGDRFLLSLSGLVTKAAVNRIHDAWRAFTTGVDTTLLIQQQGLQLYRVTPEGLFKVGGDA